MSERRRGREDTQGRSALILTENELAVLEESNPDGLTAHEVAEVFSSKGVKLSEATFRKYVQIGLLPRSRRVRRRGRRGGSLGLYPVSVVRRIVEIKNLLAQDFTMEEIRQKYLCATSEIDELEQSIGRVFNRFSSALDELERTGEDVKLLKKEWEKIKSMATDLTTSFRELERRMEARAQAQRNVRQVV